MLRVVDDFARTEPSTTMQRDEEWFFWITVRNHVRQASAIDVDKSHHGEEPLTSIAGVGFHTQYYGGVDVSRSLLEPLTSHTRLYQVGCMTRSLH